MKEDLGQAATAASSPAVNPAVVVVATSLGLFVNFVDSTVANVALPAIQDEFGVGESSLQWVTASYTLVEAMLIMSAATLADRFGRRSFYVGGLVVFMVGSIGCALSPSLAVLTAMRGLQGAGAAGIAVTSLALLSHTFTDKKQKARAIGAWTGVANLGLAVGPLLGGYLVSTVGWRAIFWINVPFCVAAVVLTLSGVAESKAPGRSLDPIGQLLFIIAIGAFVFTVIEGPHGGWWRAEMVTLLVVAASAAVLFVLVELRSDDPMMDLRVFRNRSYSASIAALLLVMVAVYGMFIVVTQYLQNVRDYSAQLTGLFLLPQSITIAVMAPLAGFAVAKVGARKPTLFGLAGLTVGLTMMALAADRVPPVTLAGLTLLGTAAGFCVAPITTVAMEGVPPSRSAMASGILAAQRALGSTLGFAVLGTVFAVSLAAQLPGRLSATLPDEAERDAVVERIVDEANPHAYAAAIGPGRPISAMPVAEVDAVLAEADAAFMTAVRRVLGIGAVCTGAGFLLVLVGARPAKRRPGPLAPDDQ